MTFIRLDPEHFAWEQRDRSLVLRLYDDQIQTASQPVTMIVDVELDRVLAGDRSRAPLETATDGTSRH